jgi:hypothetical protein
MMWQVFIRDKGTKEWTKFREPLPEQQAADLFEDFRLNYKLIEAKIERCRDLQPKPLTPVRTPPPPKKVSKTPKRAAIKSRSR